MDTKTGQCQNSEENSGRKRQGYRDKEGTTTGKLPRGLQVTRCRPGAEKGGDNRYRNGRICRHVLRGIGTSGGKWRVVGAGPVHVGGASHRERRWGAVEIERVLKRNGYGWGEGSKEGGKNDPDNGKIKSWGREID